MRRQHLAKLCLCTSAQRHDRAAKKSPALLLPEARVATVFIGEPTPAGQRQISTAQRSIGGGGGPTHPAGAPASPRSESSRTWHIRARLHSRGQQQQQRQLSSQRRRLAANAPHAAATHPTGRHEAPAAGALHVPVPCMCAAVPCGTIPVSGGPAAQHVQQGSVRGREARQCLPARRRRAAAARERSAPVHLRSDQRSRSVLLGHRVMTNARQPYLVMSRLLFTSMPQALRASSQRA